MGTNYKKIDEALQRLEEANEAHRKIAAQRVGMISGGPDIDDENAEQDAAWRELRRLSIDAVRNGCRASALYAHLDGAPAEIIDEVSFLIEERKERGPSKKLFEASDASFRKAGTQ